jgi:predicted transcriptional regulator
MSKKRIVAGKRGEKKPVRVSAADARRREERKKRADVRLIRKGLKEPGELLEKIREGLRELDAGLGIDHAEVEKRMEKWLK